MRVAAGLAFASLVVLALTACGGRSASSERTRAAASPTTVILTPVPQSLTFTGYLSGEMSAGAGECRTSKRSAIFQVTIAGDLAGSRHSIRAVAESYDGPGTYGVDAPRRATVRLDNGAGSAGNLIVNDDGASGSIDVDLIDGEHVSGTWSCTVIPE
jgi:hypothetical protein